MPQPTAGHLATWSRRADRHIAAPDAAAIGLALAQRGHISGDELGQLYWLDEGPELARCGYGDLASAGEAIRAYFEPYAIHAADLPTTL